MSATLERQVMNAVVMYSKRQEWKKWGLHRIRRQGAAILLEGPPGTGKTVIAEHLSLRIRKKGLKSMSFADFGSHVPGENARQIRKFFKEAHENGEMTIVLDECEAVLWDRSRAGSTAMWMLEVIDELLVQIGKYPGLIILISNKSEILDSALDRRLLARIYVGRPEAQERAKLWRDKMPEEHPLKLTLDNISKLATLQLSGAEIENVIMDYSSDCLRANRKPNFEGLYEFGMDLEKTIIETLLKREKASAGSQV